MRGYERRASLFVWLLHLVVLKIHVIFYHAGIVVVAIAHAAFKVGYGKPISARTITFVRKYITARVSEGETSVQLRLCRPPTPDAGA